MYDYKRGSLIRPRLKGIYDYNKGSGGSAPKKAAAFWGIIKGEGAQSALIKETSSITRGGNTRHSPHYSPEEICQNQKVPPSNIIPSSGTKNPLALGGMVGNQWQATTRQ